MTLLLELTELACRRDQRRLFAPLSSQVSPGDCVELLGPNGSGKSTLLRTLAGTHQQYDGQFQLDHALYQGHRVGLDDTLTPLENLRWYLALSGRSASTEQLAQVLKQVGVYELALSPCAALSQGQQRRVAMARWLLSEAKLWLLDEPLTALDQAGQALLTQVLQAHCDGGGAVLCATHHSLALPTRRQLELQVA